MIIDWANMVGLTGSAIFIVAFAYSNFAASVNKLWYNAANLLGAVLLLASLSVHFNLAAAVLELAWGAIALAGLILAVRARLRGRT